MERLVPHATRQGAHARAGFLRGRPDRRKPATLEEAREEIELFHAHCDAGLWNEADGVLVALDNPKHRFLAPAFERDVLLRFFPGQDHRQRPLWPGFGRYRSLAICFELLGQFDAALDTYLLLDETRAVAWTPRMVGEKQQPTGLGWFVQPYNGELVVWHFGLIPNAYSSLILKIPQRKLTLILLANSDGLSAPFQLQQGDVTRSLFATLFLRLFL